MTKAEIKETLKDEQTQDDSLAELKSELQQCKEHIMAQSLHLTNLQRQIDEHGVTATSQHKAIGVLRDQLTINALNQRRLSEHVTQTIKFTE